MKKRLLSFGVILCMLLNFVFFSVSAENDVWDGSIADGFESGSGTEEDPYIIKTAPQLAYLAQSVNSGTTYSGQYIKLANDIVLNTPDMFAYDEDGVITGAAKGKTPNEWTAIGSTDEPNVSSQNILFFGIFDGDNHEVKGIYINKSGSKSDQGLFGLCDGAVIKNVGVTDGYICGNENVGGVVGYNFATSVENCYNTATVIGSGSVGGIVGYNEAPPHGDAILNGCYNTGRVIGRGSVGGVVGRNYAYESGMAVTLKNCYNTGNVTGEGVVGGVAGSFEADSGKILSCYNLGNISGNEFIGGIVGFHSDFGGATEIEDCYNTGNVIGNTYVAGVLGRGDEYGITKIGRCYNTGTITSKYDHAGGIVGLFDVLSSDQEKPAIGDFVTIEYCYNTGSIKGNDFVGGVAGSCPNVKNSYNTGNIIGNDSVGGVAGLTTAKNCYNTGVINGSSFLVDAITGLGSENCYYLDSCIETNITNEPTALTSLQMKQLSSFTGFDFDTVWTMDGNPDYPYPELTGMEYIGDFIVDPPEEPHLTGTVTLPDGITAPEGGVSVTLWLSYFYGGGGSGHPSSGGGGGGGTPDNPSGESATVIAPITYEAGYSGALYMADHPDTINPNWYNNDCDKVEKEIVTEILIPEGQSSGTYSIPLESRFDSNYGYFRYGYQTDSSDYFGGGSGSAKINLSDNTIGNIKLSNIVPKIVIKGTVTLPPHNEDITYTVYAELNREIYDNEIHREEAYKCEVTATAGVTESEYEIPVKQGGDYYVYIVFENREFVRQEREVLNLTKTAEVNFADFENSDKYKGTIYIPSELAAQMLSDEKILGTLYLQSIEAPYYAIMDTADFNITVQNNGFEFELINDTPLKDVIVCFRPRFRTDIGMVGYMRGNYKNNNEVAHLTRYATVLNGGLSNILINLEDRPIDSISGNPLTLSVGEQANLNVATEPKNTTDLCIEYESLNPEIATVDKSGNVTAITDGTAKIQCTIPYRNSNNKFTVTVNVGTSTAHTDEFVIGDLNGDGRVTALDNIILARHLAGWKGYETLPYKQ